MSYFPGASFFDETMSVDQVPDALVVSTVSILRAHRKSVSGSCVAPSCFPGARPPPLLPPHFFLIFILFCARVGSLAASMSQVTKFSSAFRLAGLSYLEVINIAATSMRRVLKEPLRTEALSEAKFHYREFVYENGAEQAPGPFCGALRRAFDAALLYYLSNNYNIS